MAIGDQGLEALWNFVFGKTVLENELTNLDLCRQMSYLFSLLITQAIPLRNLEELHYRNGYDIHSANFK